MTWYYDAGGGQRQGPVSETEFDQLIAAGTIRPETLVWREGMTGWLPLREARTAVPPTATPAMPGTERCDSCGQFFPPTELIQIQDRRICETCKPAVVQQLQQGGDLPSALALDRSGPAWEHRNELGVVKAAWETMQGVLTKPVETFSGMKREGGLLNPLLFHVLIGTIGGVASLIYQFGFSAMGAAAQQQGGAADQLAAMGFGTVGIVAFAIFMPVILAVMAFIYAGVLHLSLMICGGAKQPFETTFRVNSYASGAAAALQVVPFCGSIVAGVWWLVAMCIGMARAHEISNGRAIAAVLLPTVVCCIGVFAFAGAMIAMAMGMQGVQPTP
ncbi:MAG TPA: GYF domain-containing protein [Chthoniobacteraceae bacterium]|jgi:hypothetical protein